jgi:hypothetical protein
MRKLLKRWYIWLGLVLLLGLAGSVMLILANPSRITQANLDRIHEGMSLEQVQAILGKGQCAEMSSGSFFIRGIRHSDIPEMPRRWERWQWDSGQAYVSVIFTGGGVREKRISFRTLSGTMKWYAKKGAEKIGVKWD